MGFTNVNERKLLAQFAYDRLVYAIGDVSREVAASVLAQTAWQGDLSDEVRQLILDRFEPERLPVPGVDFLPEHDRYFVTVEGAAETEVPKRVYVQVERGCGFRNTLDQPDEPATSSFSSGPIRGRIAYGRGMGLPLKAGA